MIRTGFIGEYDHTVDEKGRISIPSKFKKYLEDITSDPDAKSMLMLIKGKENCIVAFPAEEWSRMTVDYTKTTTLQNINDGSGMRPLSRPAAEGAIDKSGRILIPAKLKEYACLKKNVVIIGVIDRFEIWDREELKKIDGR